jgi:hypothetical protein
MKVVIIVRGGQVRQRRHLVEGGRRSIFYSYARDDPWNRGHLIEVLGVHEVTDQLAHRKLALTIYHSVDLGKCLKESSHSITRKRRTTYHNGQIRKGLLDTRNEIER